MHLALCKQLLRFAAFCTNFPCMRISFCTTNMDKADQPEPLLRLRHLQQTLPQNLRDNVTARGPEVEFVVLDYNSVPELREWIFSDPRLTSYLKSGILKYYRTEEPENFHMSHAKNMAHRLATGDVLCNLDSDNFTGHRFADYLASVFRKFPDSVVNPSLRVSKMFDHSERGFFGRLIIRKDDFERLHGYDETFQSWGNEDTDLIIRAKGMGLHHRRMENLSFLQVIGHDNRSRVCNMHPKDEIDAREEDIKEAKSRGITRKFLAKMPVLLRPIQANPGGHFGMGTATGTYGDVIELNPQPSEPVKYFDRVARGLPELVRGRLAPRIITSSDVPNAVTPHVAAE